MRVLFVTDLFWPLIGGIEVWSARVVTALAARGHEVRVVTSRSDVALPDRDELEGVVIERLDFRAAVEDRRLDRFGEALDGIRRIKREFAPDVIHLGTVGWSSLFHLLTREAWPAPWLVTLTQERLDSQASAGDTLLGRALASADWVSSVSRAVLDQAIELEPGVASRSSVDYWGMPPPPAPAAAHFDPPRLLCVGRLVNAKGFDLALEAVATLGDRCPRLTLAVVGEGPERERLERMAGALGIRDRVTFEGWIDPTEICARMARASAIVLPSRREGLPVVAVEAAWAGRPIVAVDVSGMREVVLDGRTGRLVAPDDRDALAAAIGEILADPDGARRMGAAGRRHATERFSLEGMMDAYEGLYDRLANRRVDARA
ncbi:MAG TPA: glycosyltransferase family 4 protein [Gemmatimonadota bacterium]|nr:glycosyltransferase family 4 protein [Gemmatimonadota bacterium]